MSVTKEDIVAEIERRRDDIQCLINTIGAMFSQELPLNQDFAVGARNAYQGLLDFINKGDNND